MASKTIRDPVKRDVNHAELQALVGHLSAIHAAFEVRLAECERVLAVDPLIGESARDFLARIKGEAGQVIRGLTLLPDEPVTQQPPNSAVSAENLGIQPEYAQGQQVTSVENASQ